MMTESTRAARPIASLENLEVVDAFAPLDPLDSIAPADLVTYDGLDEDVIERSDSVFPRSNMPAAGNDGVATLPLLAGFFDRLPKID